MSADLVRSDGSRKGNTAFALQKEAVNMALWMASSLPDAILWTKTAKAAFGLGFIWAAVHRPHEGSAFFSSGYPGNVSHQW